eukprot:12401611-Alexandrium_andersonii.AAC.1
MSLGAWAECTCRLLVERRLPNVFLRACGMRSIVGLPSLVAVVRVKKHVFLRARLRLASDRTVRVARWGYCRVQAGKL